MMAVVQRVSEAAVRIDGQVRGQIGRGFLVLLGITHTDTPAEVTWLAKKIAGLRIFTDDAGKMNLDLASVDGNVLLISQFTLYGDARRGNRPSFIDAARPEVAVPLYEQLIARLEAELGQPIQTGEFGADMQVSLLNDGPVTIIIDTDERNR